VDARTETVFGDDVTVADVVWSGPQPTMASRAAEGGVKKTAASSTLADVVQAAMKKKRPVHFLAPYRAEHVVKLAALTGLQPAKLKDKRSLVLHKAVAAQRLYKTPEEVADIEMAVDVSREMYAAAMRAAKPGLKEQQVVAEIAKVVMAPGCSHSV